jgi:heptosyltransferase II
MQRILIVQTAFIGDVILITPLIKAVHKLYPTARIDALVVPAAAKLLQNNPHLHRVLTYPKRQSPLKAMQTMIRDLKAGQYDMAISPHSSGRTHLILYLAGIPIRVGFDRGTLPFLLTLKTPHPRGIHKIEKNLSLLKLLSDKQFSMQTELFPSASDFTVVDSLLKDMQGKRLIAMAPGSVWATKCWPVEYYLDLAKGLLRHGFALLLIGGKEDKPKCDAIATEIGTQQVLNLAGQTNLLESTAAISQCKAMICNDSGALHLANAMKVKVFAFFGPTVQRIGYYPFREGDRVFETDLECRPCSSHGPQKCPLKHHKCMRLITPAAVLDEILKSLEQA